jgi:hypothetical protein
MNCTTENVYKAWDNELQLAQKSMPLKNLLPIVNSRNINSPILSFLGLSL